MSCGPSGAVTTYPQASAYSSVRTNSPSLTVYVRGMSVSVRVESSPTGVRLDPGGAALPFRYADGEICVEIPRLAIHSVLTITTANRAPRPHTPAPIPHKAADGIGGPLRQPPF